MSTDITPTFQDITPTTKTPPTMNGWYVTQTISGVTEESKPMMLSAGWEPVSTRTDKTVWPWVVTYTMRRTSLLNQNVLHELLTDFTNSFNEGRAANHKRFEDVVTSYKEMLDKTQVQLAAMEEHLDDAISIHVTTLDELDADYDELFEQIKTEIDGLALTLDADRLRVNDNFDGQISAAQQDLINRGLYTSGGWPTIQAGIEDRRETQLTEISQREQQLVADLALRKNEIYLRAFQMRNNIINSKMALTDRKQQFLRYELSERNNVLVGMYGFVERRNDGYPDLNAMAQLTASIAESGASSWYSGGGVG